ncbi:MAG TPA: macrolide family glycosyltransferase [Pseudogracilibacillus sp.]|nr:macrolide family glycosyltransferase [Pseudogracilibacillus sp.]
MSTIVFFSLPAYGHTNPTIPVVHALTAKGHQVIYYSFKAFKGRIEHAGATFVGCDAYLPKISQKELDKQAGKDFAALIEMLSDTTIALQEKVLSELEALAPDCIVSDALCLWGTLFAKKLKLPYVCSTSSFAFNQHTAKLMRGSFAETVRMLFGMRRIHKKLRMLRNHGYEVKGLVSVLENDNGTDTIVYTAESFQPFVDTFSNRFAFVGPSMEVPEIKTPQVQELPLIYVSLGTVLKNRVFMLQCIKAFQHEKVEVIIVAGEDFNISTLGEVPDHITIKNVVSQLEILQTADVFITHSGMNSVNESLSFGVPMVVFPQHSEQRLVAEQVIKAGAGVELKKGKERDIRQAVQKLISNPVYKQHAKELGKKLKDAGGAAEAAEKIEEKINKGKIKQ